MSSPGPQTPWLEKTCRPCHSGDPPLLPETIARQLTEIDGWDYLDGELVKVFRFKNFLRSMAFVNAVAWVAHAEDHHPELEVGYSRVKVRYRTHAISGLSDNDFICAAKVDALRP